MSWFPVGQERSSLRVQRMSFEASHLLPPLVGVSGGLTSAHILRSMMRSFLLEALPPRFHFLLQSHWSGMVTTQREKKVRDYTGVSGENGNLRFKYYITKVKSGSLRLKYYITKFKSSQRSHGYQRYLQAPCICVTGHEWVQENRTLSRILLMFTQKSTYFKLLAMDIQLWLTCILSLKLVFVCVFLCCCICFLKRYMTPLKITVLKTLRMAAQFY